FVRATGLPAWHPQSRGPAVAPRIRAILGTVIPRLEASQIFCSAENGAIRTNRTEKTGYGVAATHYPPSVTACLTAAGRAPLRRAPPAHETQGKGRGCANLYPIAVTSMESAAATIADASVSGFCRVSQSLRAADHLDYHLQRLTVLTRMLHAYEVAPTLRRQVGCGPLASIHANPLRLRTFAVYGLIGDFQ